MKPGQEPDFTPHHWMPSRSEMCAQVGTIVLGSFHAFDSMPGTYGENWYVLLDMLREQQMGLETLTTRVKELCNKIDDLNNDVNYYRLKGLG